MPKKKSNSGAKKRFKKTASGRIKRYRSRHRHFLTKKSANTKRRLRSSTLVSPSDEKKIEALLA